LNFYDSHCHLLNMAEKDGKLITITAEAIAENRLTNAIDVATSGEHMEKRLDLMKQCAISWFSMGLYPSHAAETDWAVQLDALTAKCHAYRASAPSEQKPKLVAIGEIGLDRYWNYAPIKDQRELCEAQIYLSNTLSLPIILHNREADADIFAMIQSCPPRSGGILHCFSSDYNFAKKMIDFGSMISFAGNLTYKNAHSIQEAALKLPLEKILVETDSPYLSPLPFRGKPNFPANIKVIYECLATIRGISLSECSLQIEQNLISLIS
jgi:TatD DNase family protein